MMQRFQAESEEQSRYALSLANELQLSRVGWASAHANAEASVSYHERALASARSEITASTEATASVHIARIAVPERALVEARMEVVRAQEAIGRDDGGESAYEEFRIQARSKEVSMTSVLHGWE